MGGPFSRADGLSGVDPSVTTEGDTPGLAGILGCSPAIRKVFATVRSFCDRTASGGTPTILLSGETGTGKGMLARAIHHLGRRSDRAYLDVNCAALPPLLLETEIFGHERGAFTDARDTRAGLFETADRGTLFLDEISMLPLDLQAKLLTVIEEKRVRRIGACLPRQVDVQVIAATNRDLSEMVERGQFREDLFHRLNVIALTLPPLRDRGEDRLLLARSFLRSLCQGYGIPERRLTDAARDCIMRYPWPGNVRELRNVLERIVMLEDGELVHARSFPFPSDLRHPAPRPGDVLRVSLPEQGFSLMALEREVLRQALGKAGGNVSRAARYLSISRRTMIYRLKKFQLYDQP
jgi:transcriptional regulator with PAS, ATPase and Fis domain